MRYNEDGTPDTSFGVGGVVTTAFDNFLAAPGGDPLLPLAGVGSLTLLPDGRIVAMGSSGSGFGGDIWFLRARYNANGTPDTTYGGGDGQAEDLFLRSSTFGAFDAGFRNAVALPDGRVIAVGLLRNGTNDYSSVVHRYDVNGARVSTDIIQSIEIDALAVLPDGKFVAAGAEYFQKGYGEIAVVRYNADGSRDSTFGEGGTAFADFGGIAPRGVTSIVVLPDQKLVVAGTSGPRPGNPGTDNLAVARFNTDGSLDSSFGGGDGKVLTDFGAHESASSLALLPDSRLLVGGSNRGSTGQMNSLLVLYNPDGSLDTSFGCGGRLVTAATGFEASDLAVYADGRVVVGSTSALARYLSTSSCTANCESTPTPTPTPTPAPTPSPTPTPHATPSPTPVPQTSVQFFSASFSVTEGCVPATLTVALAGPVAGPVLVDYTVNEGTAKQKTDFTYVAGTLLPTAANLAAAAALAESNATDATAVSGTLLFAAGETAKEITVLITEDGFAEGTENLSATLSNPRGASLGSVATATLDINDNETVDAQTNPVDDPAIYVCQLYHDFLHRQPDPGGQAFWTAEITRCGADAACVAERRHNVAAAAFFLSIEFQRTGYFISLQGYARSARPSPRRWWSGRSSGGCSRKG